MGAIAKGLRRLLDGIYFAAGCLAAVFLVGILVLIVAQMVARWSGSVLPGGAEYAGYCMAASSFLALAYALNRGAHIRVGLLFNILGKHGRWLELWCLAISAGLATYFARYAIKGTYWSWKLNDISQGQDATPIWIPQIAMSLGTVLIALALWDNLATLLIKGRDNIEAETLETQSHGE